MSILKIISDVNCSVRCDFQEVGNIQVGELFRLQLKKGCYILEFLVEDIVICSMDYTIETNDEEPLLRLNLKEQAEKKIMERQLAFVFSEDGRTILGCNKSFEGELIIPDGIEHIANSAFEDSKATSLHIPDSVTSIGEGAFYSCSGLTSIVVEEGNTKYDSRNNCNAIIETSSNTLRAGCKNTTIPNSVTSIEAYAFSGCSGLTSITIPNSVTSIGDHAFSGCCGLTSVTIPNSVMSIGWGAFAECSGLTSITIPNGVTWIRGFAFYGCSGLTSITISSSVTSIEESAFSDCSCLTSITIPSSVTSIENGAFASCKNLKEIIIPNSVISIGGYAFAYCSALISITIPDSVTNIGANAFMETGWYNNQDDGLLYLDNWLLGYKGDKPTGELTIAEGTNRIGDDAFAHCSALTSVSIPNSMTSIGEEAFSDCI